MYGNLILEKFKSNSEDEIISLGEFRLLSCEGVEFTHFFGNIYMFEINFQHHSQEFVKGQGVLHNFKLTVKNGCYESASIFSNESLNIVGEKGLINSIKRICMELIQARLDVALGGDDV